MKQLGKRLLLCWLTVILLTATALANSAPPDYQITVKISNRPEEPYCLDLLEETENQTERLPKEGIDQALLAALRDAVPQGWTACSLSVGQWEEYFQGDLVGEQGVHRLHGRRIPRVFRLLIVTQSGETWVSEPMERETLRTTVLIDWEQKTVRTPPLWLLYAGQLLSTLIPTLVIEGLVLLLFRYSWKKNWKPFLIINLITQTGLHLFLAYAVLHGGLYNLIFALYFMVPIELIIALIEANLYKIYLCDYTKRRAFWYGITANAASYALGWLAVELTWRIT